MRLRVYDLEFDDGNLDEMHEHHVSEEEVWQVLDNQPGFFENKKGHEAPVVMVGPTFGGRMLTIPIKPIDEESGLWRPATAWESTADERLRYER